MSARIDYKKIPGFNKDGPLIAYDPNFLAEQLWQYCASPHRISRVYSFYNQSERTEEIKTG